LSTDAREKAGGYQESYSTLKNDFVKKVTKAAAAKVNEKWLKWKANELDRLATTHQNEMAARARKKDISYFIIVLSICMWKSKKIKVICCCLVLSVTVWLRPHLACMCWICNMSHGLVKAIEYEVQSHFVGHKVV
jgi:hypothetical protein